MSTHGLCHLDLQATHWRTHNVFSIALEKITTMRVPNTRKNAMWAIFKKKKLASMLISNSAEESSRTGRLQLKMDATWRVPVYRPFSWEAWDYPAEIRIGNASEPCGGPNRLTLFNTTAPAVPAVPFVNPGVNGFFSLGCYVWVIFITFWLLNTSQLAWSRNYARFALARPPPIAHPWLRQS